MASWIVHLRIAENLLGLIDGLDTSQFAIGNIAPDSGIPDAEWRYFDPPVEALHFKAPEDAPYSSSDLAFYRRYLAGAARDDRGRYSLLLGYFAHLLSDNLWDAEIGRPTQARLAAQFEADPEFMWEVKRDWYGLDFVYVREHPDSLFWRVFLNCEYNDEQLDFLPGEAIRQRIKYITEFYQRRDEKVQAMIARPFIYLSRDEMDAFVERTTDRLHRIYTHLGGIRTVPDGVSSALELY